MVSPMIVGTTAIVAIPKNRNREDVRFQNVGASFLYFTRYPIIPTYTNYEFIIGPPIVGEINEAIITTNSTAQFNVISNLPGGILAIYETNKIR